jgi:Fe2+ or Zn2+ uptake regulation protein
MKTKIGEMAGKVWNVLGEKEAVAVSKLPQILKEKGEIVYQALGWLAREGKVDFHKKEGKTFVSLSHEEHEIFKRSL